MSAERGNGERARDELSISDVREETLLFADLLLIECFSTSSGAPDAPEFRRVETRNIFSTGTAAVYKTAK